MSLPALVPPASLDPTQPLGSQNVSEGDDWIRYIQNVLKTYLVNIGGVVNATHTELNNVVGTTSLVQNQLDALMLGINASLGNAPAWVSGRTYAVPAVVYSPIDFLNYRKSTISSVTTTDPSLDPTNWTPMYQPRGAVLLDVKTASASATIDFNSFITSAYDEYEIHYINAVPAVGSGLQVRTSSNAGVSFDAGATDYTYVCSTASVATPTPAGFSSAGATNIALGGSTVFSTTPAHGGVSGVLTLYAPSSTTAFKSIKFQQRAALGAAAEELATGIGTRVSASAVNAVRLLFGSGATTSGTFKLFGIRKTV